MEHLPGLKSEPHKGSTFTVWLPASKKFYSSAQIVTDSLPEDVSNLKDNHILWADYVFISGMNVHRESFKNIAKRCKELGVKIVAGGPMCTTEYEEFEDVDHYEMIEAIRNLKGMAIISGYDSEIYDSLNAQKINIGGFQQGNKETNEMLWLSKVNLQKGRI